ncbi:MAG: hypothetical protein AB7F76_01810 [Parvibaculaceae bacterium]
MPIERPARVEQLKGHAALAFAGDFESRRGRTALPGPHDHPMRRNDDQPPHCRFRRPQHAEHDPVDRPRQSLDRTTFSKANHGEEDGHNAQQRLAIAFDGQDPVHLNILERIENIVKREGEAVVDQSVAGRRAT